MCFRIVFDKTLIGRLPGFSGIDRGALPSGDISAFTFPPLPILASDNREKAFLANWGLIPPWVREPERAKKIRSGTVNARSETVHEKPSFRDSWPGKRCLLPVTAFFEPHLAGKTKETWRINRAEGELFFLGGLYCRTSPLLKEYPPLTFALLTLEAEGLLAEVHNEKKRMPLIMTEERAYSWLASKDTSSLFERDWQLDQKDLKAEPIEKRERKSDFLKETSLFSIFN